MIKGKNLNTFRHTPWKEENSVASLAKRTFLPSFGVLRTEAEKIELRLDPTFLNDCQFCQFMAVHAAVHEVCETFGLCNFTERWARMLFSSGDWVGRM